MNILVATHNYPRFPGDPAGAFVARLATGLAVRGDTVRVVAPHAHGLADAEQQNGVVLRRFRYAPAPMEQLAYTGHLHRGGSSRLLTALLLPAFLTRFRNAMRNAVREAAPNVIHAHWWFPGAWAAAPASIPLVITCHGTDVELLKRSALLRVLANGVFARATAVTTVSASLQRKLVAAIPQVGARTQVLRMPIDLDAFSAARSATRVSPPRILYAGNLVPIKGVDLLIRAIARLRDTGHTASLRILGEGPDQAKLQALIAQLDLSGMAEIRPFVPQEAMTKEYGEAMIVVLPTRGDAEGLGLTLVEALAAGCAVIGSASGGIPEVVQDNITGLLFRDGDDAHLAERLAHLLTDPVVRQRLTHQGEAWVREEFDAARAVARYAKLLSDVSQR